MLVVTLLEKQKKRQRIVQAFCAGVVLVSLIWFFCCISVTAPTLTAEVGNGRGAGGVDTTAMHQLQPALCNPFDPSCLLNGIAGAIASQLQGAFQPIANLVTKSPYNIITQTPAKASYANGTIMAINQGFVEAFDLALTGLLAIGAVNIIIGHHWQTLRTSLGELIPRAILVTAAVHMNLDFIGKFIELENDLASGVIHTAGVVMLTHLIVGLVVAFQFTTLLAWILAIVLGVMMVYLFFQMVGRIALVGIGIAVAPLGLGCFLLPQTLRWGRLWLTTFTSAVMVQFLQVLALGLGGAFLTSFVDLTNPAQSLIGLFLAIGTLGLVLKIPGMLQNWALHPAMEGGRGNSSNDSQDNSTGSEAMGFGGGSGGGGFDFGSGGSTSANMGGGMSGGTMMEGTIVTEESGTLLLLF